MIEGLASGLQEVEQCWSLIDLMDAHEIIEYRERVQVESQQRAKAGGRHGSP